MDKDYKIADEIANTEGGYQMKTTEYGYLEETD